MTPQGVKRKLTAILSADVKGYHRLIAKDEAGTLRRKKRTKQQIKTLP
jgi:hypothetical protein